MPIPTGTRFGRYEILGLLGSGGMGEVYRAHDGTLGRDVAIKILLEPFVTDPDRVRRFEQEARAAAALNHPNILAVYDVGAHDGTVFVVSELLDGRTLSGILASGVLPLRKAANYAAQIAEGLAAAHEKGIVHRDVKPANIVVTSDERVKILDFGLARMRPEVLSSPSAEGTPTMTLPGTILGTAGYAAPEQVRGEPVDHRADIFSFGSVLYEMLTHRRAFQRDSVPSTLAAILDAEPPSWAGDGSQLSLRLLRLSQRCLEKAPQARFQSARDITMVISDETATPPEDVAARRPARLRTFVFTSAALVCGILTALVWARLTVPRQVGSVASAAFELAPPEGDQWAGGLHPAISNDGQRIVYGVLHAGVIRLYVRTLSDPVARLLPGTDGARQPFFSPDGSRIAFFTDDQLKSVALDNGQPQVICPASGSRGGAWGDDGFIVFAAGLGAGLSRVSANGGVAVPFTVLDIGQGESSHRFPYVLPGSTGVLFTVQVGGTDPRIALQRAGSTAHSTIVAHGESARYAKEHLIFVNEHQEVALAPFSVSSMTLTGPIVAQPERATRGANQGDSSVSVALDGTLVYLPFESEALSLAIVSRQGVLQPLAVPPRHYSAPRISPDGKRIALVIQGGVSANDVWIGDTEGHFTPFTTDRLSRFPAWAPDNQRIAFNSSRTGVSNVFVQALDGNAPAVQITSVKTEALPSVWLPDGQTLEISVTDASTGISRIHTVTPGSEPVPVRLPPDSTAYGRVSPDGRWLSYLSARSGQWEAYVTSFPAPGRTFPVSQGVGGREAVWSHSSDELFFRRLTGDVVSVKVGPAGPLVETPRRIPMPPFVLQGGTPGIPAYDVFPDGRFLIVQGETSRQDRRPLVVVQNWAARR